MKSLIFIVIVLSCFNVHAAKIALAGGCFWCMEEPFEKIDGVSTVISGYMGGDKKDPTYDEVSSGKTKHLESVLITYDENKIALSDLLEVYWRQINPTDDGGQFVDRGHQYSTAIFVFNNHQEKAAKNSKLKLQKSGRFEKKIVTPVVKAKEFYPAEKYHQDFYKTNTVKYKFYRYRSGRDQYLDEKWGKERSYSPQRAPQSAGLDKSEKLKKLSPMQYKVTQEDQTEPPFKNKYWNNKKEGIYVDIVSGEPLFSSTHQYKSGTGWPSFYKALEPSNIVEKEDNLLWLKRTELRSKKADGHLGHIFNDGPRPTGLRYCVNSAALEFVPKDKLKERGLEKYLKLFKKKTRSLE